MVQFFSKYYGKQVKEFTYRNAKPLFQGQGIVIKGKTIDNSSVKVWVENTAGHVCVAGNIIA